jgi:hypothetical protein
MHKLTFLLLSLFIGTVSHANQLAFCNSEISLQTPDSTRIQYVQKGDFHTLTFPNELSIPKENYAKFFYRMKHIYPEIIEIKSDENSSHFTLFFEQRPTQLTRLNEILQKFSITNFSIQAHD